MMPFLLNPCCKDYIWGGNRLREFGKSSDAGRIAESWELSTHPDGESIIASGTFTGMSLTQFLKEHPEATGKNCRHSDKFPVIVKLIDAYDNLSVQVHPDKTELWYVIDAEPGASILYGFRKELTQPEFRKVIENGSVPECMNSIPVKTGDAFWIPAGTLHAIGKGILIAEIQQNSNTTYRVYDYDRGRELHIAQALEVANLTPSENLPSYPVYHVPVSSTRVQRFGGCQNFSVSRFEIHNHLSFSGSVSDSYRHILILDGSGILESQFETLPFRKGDSIFVPADVQTPFTLKGEYECIMTTTEQEQPLCEKSKS